MNHTLAQYTIACIHNSKYCPTPELIMQYLMFPLDGIESLPLMHYKMLDVLGKAIDENRADDALNIFNLIWWDMNVSSAQRTFDLVKDMECDPDDALGSHTVMLLSHTIIERFPTLT